MVIAKHASAVVTHSQWTIAARFPPRPLSSLQCTFSLAGFGTRGSKECLCAWFFQQIPSLHCSWCTTRVMLEMACWRKAAVCPPPVCPCHLPILLFGHKLHTFSTKATIRDIGQFGTHCHRLPFNKINLVKNEKTLDASFEKFLFPAPSFMTRPLTTWRWWRRWPKTASGNHQLIGNNTKYTYITNNIMMTTVITLMPSRFSDPVGPWRPIQGESLTLHF